MTHCCEVATCLMRRQTIHQILSLYLPLNYSNLIDIQLIRDYLHFFLKASKILTIFT